MESTTGENEKRLLASILKERLIETKNTITYKELLEEEMPLFLRNFLQNRVKKYFYTDEPFQIKNSNRYDFNYEPIKSIKQQLHKAFEEATLFTKEEIKEIINKTVGLQFDLLVSPRKTLVKIFFKNKSERTQADILQILTGLIDDRIFIQALINEIKEFDQFHIIEEDFNKILISTQEKAIKKDLLKTFMSDVTSFLDFVGHIKDNEECAISKEILKLLLEERDLDKYYNAFDSVDSNGFIDVKIVATQLKDYINNNGKDDFIQEDDDIEDFIVSVVETDNGPVGESETIEIDTSSEEKTEAIEIDNSLTEDTETIAPEPVEKAAEKKSKAKKHFPKIKYYQDPEDIIIDRNKIEYQPEGPFAPLESLIDDKSKKLIQRKIFNKDELAFNNFIMRLEEITNWKKAKQIIDDELLMRCIQPFSREALKLGDLVFNRYFPKKLD